MARPAAAGLLVRVSFTIPHRPVAAARMTRYSKYTSDRASRYLSFKSVVQTYARMEMRERPPLEGPLALMLRFTYRGRRPGDLSNLVKAIEDGGNGILWVDDRVIDVLNASIHKGDTEGVEVTILAA